MEKQLDLFGAKTPKRASEATTERTGKNTNHSKEGSTGHGFKPARVKNLPHRRKRTESDTAEKHPEQGQSKHGPMQDTESPKPDDSEYALKRQLYGELRRKGLNDEYDIRPSGACADVYLGYITGNGFGDNNSTLTDRSVYTKWMRNVKDGHFYKLSHHHSRNKYLEPTDVSADDMKKLLDPKPSDDSEQHGESDAED